MRLLEEEDCFVIDDFFKGIISGFTKPTFKKKSILELDTLHKDFKLASLRQFHSPKINLIRKEGIYEGDGLFTDRRNLMLTVKTADCLPIFLYSKILGVIGIIHMGWRGALSGILGNIPFDLDSFKVIAGVGLRKCCYVVGDDFLNFKSFLPFLIRKKGVLYFNVIEFTKNSLFLKGLKEENFLDLDICSFCSKENFFSYRRDKTNLRTISFILKL